ncbi:MAG: hypothetical protein EOP87_02490 [Verrucomicrobiaceae bacterium]|nr:MAG: hypothetical protein EOP87_02490 [Verrucomicrobiaceae bacterium]
MGIDQIAPEALRLPARDRALLAASLWESIGDPFMLADDGSEEEAVALAISRDLELQSGTVAPLTHAELMKRLR